MVSCDIDSSDPTADSKFLVDLDLFNKFKNPVEGNGNCDDYIQNGNGVSKYVNTSLPPVASFQMNLDHCIGNDILVDNTTILGLWGTEGECVEDPTFQWYVKKPGFSSWNAINTDVQIVTPGLTINDWLIGESSDNFLIPDPSNGHIDLLLPAAFVDTSGCWAVKLEASNIAVCTSPTSYEFSFNVETDINLSLIHI